MPQSSICSSFAGRFRLEWFTLSTACGVRFLASACANQQSRLIRAVARACSGRVPSEVPLILASYHCNAAAPVSPFSAPSFAPTLHSAGSGHSAIRANYIVTGSRQALAVQYLFTGQWPSHSCAFLVVVTTLSSSVLAGLTVLRGPFLLWSPAFGAFGLRKIRAQHAPGPRACGQCSITV